MAKNSTLLTVVIPSRDRLETLKQCVDALIYKLPDQVAVLVSDNWSTPDVREFLPTHERLQIVRTDRRLSMPAHWRFALKHVDSKYLTIIGDDDLIWIERLRQVMPLIVTSDFPLICWHRGAYFWSTFDSDQSSGSIQIFNDSQAKRVVCSELFGAFLDKAFDHHYLPSVYNSLISCEIARAKFGQLGDLVPDRCIAPDVASAFNISKRFDSALYLSFPISISGISRHSNGMNIGLQRQFYGEFDGLELEPRKFATSLLPLSDNARAFVTLLHDYCAATNDFPTAVWDGLPQIFYRLLSWYFMTDQISLPIRVLSYLQLKGYTIPSADLPRPGSATFFEAGVLPFPENTIKVRFNGLVSGRELLQVSDFLASQEIAPLTVF